LFASGNVEIQNEGMTGTGDKMEYYEAERKMILIGNSKVWQDNNLVTGHTVVVFLDQGKSIVERGEKKGERVKAFFYPGGEGPQSDKQQ
jgi:lipopolysaccharide export system protein LptA